MPTILVTTADNYVKIRLEEEGQPIGATLVRPIYIETDGYIQVGTGTKDDDLDGIAIDDAEIVGQKDGVDQFVLRASDGKATAGGGVVVLDDNGVSIDASTIGDPTAPYYISFVYGTTALSKIYHYLSATFNQLNIIVPAYSDKPSTLTLQAKASSAAISEILLRADAYTTYSSQIYLYASASEEYIEIDSDVTKFTGELVSRKSSVDHSGHIYVPLRGNDVVVLYNTGGVLYNGSPSMSANSNYAFDLNDAYNNLADDIQAVLLYIQCTFATAAVASYLIGREAGDTTNLVSLRSQVSAMPIAAQWTLPVDTLGRFNIYCNNAQATSVLVRLVGYYI